MQATRYWGLFAVVALLAAAASPAQAHGRCGHHGRGCVAGVDSGLSASSGSSAGAVVTVTGTVREVMSEVGISGAADVMLLLDADGQAVEVNLGPAADISSSGLRFEVGDQVMVSGAGSVVDDRLALAASEIRKGSFSLALRGGAGSPAWSGQGSQAAPSSNGASYDGHHGHGSCGNGQHRRGGC